MVSAFVCMCVEILRRLVLKNGDIWFWRLYDIVGEKNINVSESYDGDIDLFHFGTSGCDPSYPPYYTGPNYRKNDIDNTEYDWGIFNKISNGGNRVGMWRTLREKEWGYLIDNNINARVLLDTIKGLILLPVNFQYPDNVETISKGATYSVNYYTINEWKLFETNGAVFLPLAGERYENDNLCNANKYGYYWSTDIYYALKISEDGCSVSRDNYNAYYAYSVRLVCDIK